MTRTSGFSRVRLYDPAMGPAIAVIESHRDIAKQEMDRLEAAINKRHEQMKKLGDDQDADVKKLRDFQVEYRAHERLLSSVERYAG